MCGIAGIFCLDNTQQQHGFAMHRMAQAMRHRGPDDEGYLIAQKNGDDISIFGGDTTPASQGKQSRFYPSRHVKTACQTPGHVFLAHRRLAILDLSPYGHQPMCTADGRYWIVYNGEIYNYKAVGQELENLGRKFLSTSDTEVLLYAYSEWGAAMLPKLDGMFAFAIWDNTKKQLFCARDRVGIKPFYYTIQNNLFVFASDIKTLIASGLYRPDVDLEGLYHTMGYGVAPRPLTAFKDVWALEQAHWLQIDRTGNIKKQRYWQIPVGTQNHHMTEAEAVDLLHGTVQEAVRKRLVADVPIGTFMSGGIDSTTVSALAAQYHPGIKAFTLGFETEAQEFNELDQARATAAMYPMEHIVQIVAVDTILDHIEAIVNCYEEPFFSLAPNYVISQLVANNNVTVVLNGLGGDELFGGYRYYRWASRWKLLQLLAPVTKIARWLGPRWQQIDAAASARSTERVHSIFHAILPDFSRQALFQSSQVREFDSVERLHQLYVGKDIEFTDDIEAMSYMDIMNYIGNHHTYRVDQFTMHFSLEGRIPLLDPDVIKVAFQIPSKYKIRGNTQKYVLRKVAEHLIHPSCLQMNKKGFRLPLALWVRGRLRDFVHNKLDQLTQRGIFVPEKIGSYLAEFEAGRRRAEHVWHLVAVELWFETFID